MRNTPDPSEAHPTGNNALENKLGLKIWRQQAQQDAIVISSDSDTNGEDSSVNSGQDVDDLKILEVNRHSGLHFAKEKDSSTLQLSLQSPPREAKQSIIVLTISDSDEEDFEPQKDLQRKIPFCSTTRKSAISRNIPTTNNRGLDSKYRNRQCPYPQEQNTSFGRVVDNLLRAPREQKATIASNTVSITNKIGLEQFDEPPTTSSSNIIESDAESSEVLVKVRVGHENRSYSFPKSKVWNRAYFRDPQAGITHFSLGSNGVYELAHPRLIDIDPEDFAFVAQFLEHGSFGHEILQADGARETFAECMSAWVSAEQLGMTDLMDHVVEKVDQLVDCHLWDLLVFAYFVYRSPGTALPAQTRLKDILATDIAQHYWEFLGDDGLSALFMQKLQDFPELERDISFKRIAVLNARLREDGY